MPPPIEANQAYTRIRAGINSETETVKRDEGLRFEDGKGLYFRKIGNWFSNFIDRFTRAKKYKEAAEKVKHALNLQFGSFSANDKTMNVGDFVFKNLPNPDKLTAHDFSIIDSYVADIMASMADEAPTPEQKAMLQHGERIFRGASHYKVAPHHVNNWAKYVYGAGRMRVALTADVKAAMEARGASDRSEVVTREIIREMGVSLDSGLNLENLQKLKAVLGHYGISTRNVDALVGTARLEAKFQAASRDLEDLRTTPLDAHETQDISLAIDDALAPGPIGNLAMEEQFNTVIAHWEDGLRALAQHLENAGTGGQEELDAIREALTKSYSAAIELAAKLENGPSLGHALSQRLRNHAAQAYDLATSLDWKPGVSLAERPSLHSPEQLNETSPLYFFQMDGTFKPNQPALSTPKVLYKGDAQHTQLHAGLRLHSAVADYNSSVQDASEALAAFQRDASDGNLHRLFAAVDSATMRSDDLMVTLDTVSSRRAGASALTGEEAPSGNQTGDFRRQLKAQREALRKLKCCVGHLNDQRNAAQDLPHSGPTENKWRAIRLEQGQMRQTYQKAWMAPTFGARPSGQAAKLQPIDERQIAPDIDDPDLEQEVEDLFGPGDDSNEQAERD